MTIHADELLLKDGVYRVVGAAVEVLNGLGHGLHKKPQSDHSR